MRISSLLSFLLGAHFRFGVTPDDVVVPPVVPPVAAPRETFSREYVSEVREEAKAWRIKAQERETALKETSDKLTAADAAANERVTAAEKAANDRVLRAELKAIAVKHGLVDMDGLKLLDLSAVKLLENGDVEGADALFEAAKKSKPYLFGTVAVGTTTPTPTPKDGKAPDVREMNREEYAKAKKAATKR